MLQQRCGTRHPVLRAATAGVIGAAVIGTGFGAAVSLRSDAVEQHRLTRSFGDSAAVTVIATEGPRAAGTARVVFHADLAAPQTHPSVRRTLSPIPAEQNRLHGGDIGTSHLAFTVKGQARSLEVLDGGLP